MNLVLTFNARSQTLQIYINTDTHTHTHTQWNVCRKVLTDDSFSLQELSASRDLTKTSINHCCHFLAAPLMPQVFMMVVRSKGGEEETRESWYPLLKVPQNNIACATILLHTCGSAIFLPLICTPLLHMGPQVGAVEVEVWEKSEWRALSWLSHFSFPTIIAPYRGSSSLPLPCLSGLLEMVDSHLPNRDNCPHHNTQQTPWWYRAQMVKRQHATMEATGHWGEKGERWSWATWIHILALPLSSLCDIEQDTSPLCTSVSPFVNRWSHSTYFIGSL